jgi:hypothetical protein
LPATAPQELELKTFGLWTRSRRHRNISSVRDDIKGATTESKLRSRYVPSSCPSPPQKRRVLRPISHRDFLDIDAVDLESEEHLSDINNISGALKLWFRELPEPLMTFELYSGFMEAASELSSRN